MPQPHGYVLFGSTEACGGKSALILGLAQYLRQQGLSIAYGKPLGTSFSDIDPGVGDEDVRFMAQALGLPAEPRLPTLATLKSESIRDRLSGNDLQDYAVQLAQRYGRSGPADLNLIEAGGGLQTGHLFGLALSTLAETLDAPVVLVCRWNESATADGILAARQQLGDRLAGVILNAVPRAQLETVQTAMLPFLERQGIPLFGILPRSALLRSISVGELIQRLKARVICCGDRTELMVESLSIGAMNVNSAMEYFRKGRNMAVVTGADRADIQLAALENSTQCLILTGRSEPLPQIIARAEEVEVPILSVNLDTLTTVERVEQAFGNVSLHEPVKADYIARFVREHVDVNRLATVFGLAASGGAAPATVRD